MCTEYDIVIAEDMNIIMYSDPTRQLNCKLYYRLDWVSDVYTVTAYDMR